MQRHKGFWALGAVVFVITSLLALVWLFLIGNKRQDQQCVLVTVSTMSKLLQQDHDSDETNGLLATDDFRALVGFTGHVQFLQQQPAARLGPPSQNDSSWAEQGAWADLLPLKLQRISLLRNGGPNGESQLSLWNDCARLKLHLAATSKELVVSSIDLETVRSNGFRKECQVRSTPIKLAAGHYYACNLLTQFPCLSHQWRDNSTFATETVALLTIRSLEFEIEASPELARSNRFTGEPSRCYS